MLGLSFAFYELQRAGPLPPQTRASWRADTLKRPGGGWLDGKYRGGYFDAGDHLKFQLPGAYSIARLAWLTHRDAGALRRTYFDARSNYRWARESVRWGADYLAAGTYADRILLHIGDIRADHGYIGRAENYPPTIDRSPKFCGKRECGDVAGETAAALAHAAVVFADRPGLRDLYWRKAKMAYALADVRASGSLGRSDDVYAPLRTYYSSTGSVSHALFGAASMFVACRRLECPDALEYLRDASALAVRKESDGGQKWYWEVAGWDNAWWDAAVMMMAEGIEGPMLDGNAAFVSRVSRFVQKWVHGETPVQISPWGQRWVSPWGSNRYAMNGAAILLMWADLPAAMRGDTGVSAHEARCAAVKQIHYVAGDNDRGSFVAGFGRSPPKRNHHRNSVCAPWEQERLGGRCDRLFADVRNPGGKCPNGAPEDADRGICFRSAARPNKFQTHGALIGGPKTPTDSGPGDRVPYLERGWNDWRTDWIGSEQAVDYNAMYTFALSMATALPRSFWATKCVHTHSHLNLTRRAGMSRKRKGPPRAKSQMHVWTDFAAHEWTRSLPANWFERPAANM